MNKAATEQEFLQQQQIERQQAQTIKQLEQIDSIDVHHALQRMSKQMRLYLKLVNDFYADQQQRAQQLLQLHDDNNLDELCRRAHSLKTFAAYVGAYDVSQYASDLEEITFKGKSDKNLVLALGQKLDLVLSQLKPIYQDSENKPAIKYVHPEFSIVKFKQLLESILPLLIRSNPAVEDQLPTLYEMSQGSEFELATENLMDYVDDIEYDAAVTLAQNILAELA